MRFFYELADVVFWPLLCPMEKMRIPLEQVEKIQIKLETTLEIWEMSRVFPADMNQQNETSTKISA